MNPTNTGKVDLRPNRDLSPPELKQVAADPTRLVVETFKYTAAHLDRLRAALRFELGARRGVLLAPQLRRAADLFAAAQTDAALRSLTDAAGLPPNSLDGPGFARFLEDLVSQKVLRENHEVVLDKEAFLKLQLRVGETYGAANAVAVPLTVLPIATPKPKAVLKAPRMGIAGMLKSGRISRSFNYRRPEKAIEADLRAKTDEALSSLAGVFPTSAAAPAGATPQSLGKVLKANPDWRKRLFNPKLHDVLKSLDERRLRDGLWRILRQERRAWSELERAKWIAGFMEVGLVALATSLASEVDGADKEALAELRSQISGALAKMPAPSQPLDAWLDSATAAHADWLALVRNPDTQQLLGHVSHHELDDVLSNSVGQRFFDSLDDAAQRTVHQGLVARLVRGLEQGIAARMISEAKKVYAAGAAELRGLSKNAARGKALAALLDAVGTSQSNIANMLRQALGGGADLTAAATSAAQRLDQQLAVLGRTTPETILSYVRSAGDPAMRLRRALRTEKDSVLDGCLETFFQAQAGVEPPSEVQSGADTMVFVAAAGLGVFAGEESPGAGVLAGTLTRFPPLIEAAQVTQLGMLRKERPI